MSLLQSLRKFADMIQGAGIPAAGFKMGFVDDPAGAVAGFSAASENADVVAVGNAEQLLVAGRDKPDTLFGLFHVVFQESGNVGVEVKVVVSIIGIAPEHIGVLGRLHLKTILGAVVSLKLSLRVLIAKPGHAVTGTEQPILLPQSVDHLIKLRLKLVRLVFPPMVEPGSVKLFSSAKIPAQMADTAGLPFKLAALVVRIQAIRRGHAGNCQFHYRSRPFFFACRFCSDMAFSLACQYSGW